MDRMRNSSREPLEIYIHIPFCVKKCAYCDFLSGPSGEERQQAYFKALKKEIRNVEDFSGRPVVSVFMGGGTPSVPDSRLTGEILDEIQTKFMMAPDAEITIEANPGTLSMKKLKDYRSHGVNRLSMGLQSPKEQELKKLGRIHTWEEFLENYSNAREVGFSNINVDLMFAIPGQKPEGWRENLRTVAALGPEHISAYSLIIEEGTPFADMELDLPDEDQEYEMYEDTVSILGEYGYRQYEISNYGKPGFACRHNKGYWQRTDYLGLGLGASSLLGDERFSNTSDMEEYLIKSGRPDKIRVNSEKLTIEDKMAEFMFLGLRMTDGVEREKFRQCFDRDIEEVYGKVLKKYKDLLLLREKNGRIFLTRKGIHVSNTVMADFLI